MSRGRSLKQAIQRNVNPFDPTTFKPGNFWQETPDLAVEVETIHQSIATAVDAVLAEVKTDGKTRTLLLTGDSGSGKSYLLGRIKRQCNDLAFFTYIGPWADSQFIWRHLLRNTVDSLLQTPAGAAESQLLLWLRSLPTLQNQSLLQWVRGKRATFIKTLQTDFSGLYQGKEFLGVLYDLLNPDLFPIAADWLRGDDLDESDLKAIKVKRSIDSEDAAQKLLANFGRISSATLPIVLCFDNLDNLPLRPDKRPDLQALFHVNSTIHNEKLSNFLLLISIITSTWKQHKGTIQPADVARIDQTLVLRPITLNQAEALWKLRLAPIHQQVSPQPTNAIAPLTRDWLMYKFPGRRTLPRNTLMLGQQLIEQYQRDGELSLPTDVSVPPLPPPPPPPTQNQEANFTLLWHRDFQKVQARITRMTQKSSPELIRALWEVLGALGMADLEAPFLTGTKYSAYSLRYRQPARVGIVWSEDRHMTSFYYLMRACERAIEQGRCDRLYLIRAADISQPQTQGHQLYRQIFAYANYLHIEPDLTSVHYLETYHSLVNAAAGGELVVGRTTPNLPELQALIRKTGVLNHCPLLQELEIVPELDEEMPTADLEQPVSKLSPTKRHRKPSVSEAAKQYALNLLATQQFMGLEMLIQTLQTQFPNLASQAAQHAVNALIQGEHLKILNPDVSLEEQIICLVPTDNGE
ncbi:MAG: ATP-binding protein [Leptolyngbya sp. SIO1D8]|nr:ATP-binding protein [Leptolyngbya sp. SIO1D8]